MRIRYLLTGLLMRAAHIEQLVDEVADLRFKHNRLEIAYRELREQLQGLEGRHDSLSAATRGRLGGRGNKAQQAPGAPLYVVPPAM